MELTANEINGILIFLILFFQLMGITLAVAFDSNLDKKHHLITMALVLASFSLILQNYAEYVLKEYISIPMLRTFVAAFGYSLRPAIIVLFIYMISPNGKHWWTWIPVGINCILYNTAYFSPLVFYISKENAWFGGPLSDLCMIVSLTLLAYHIFVGIKEFGKRKRIGAIMPIIFTLFVIGCIILDIKKDFWIPHWVDYVTIAVVACCEFYYLWQHFILVRRYQNAILAEQRFNMLLSQIQPHFIFNSLSAISEIDDVPEKAQKAIVDFSDYLRENLDAMTMTELVPFETELAHIQKYVNLEILRFGDKINVIFDLQCTDFLVPTLTVQMLVENAIKHGITKRYEGGSVTISTQRNGNAVVITVKDDGVGFDTEKEISAEHIGINNIQKRLEYLVNGTLQIASEIGKGTTATITIPGEYREKKR